MGVRGIALLITCGAVVCLGVVFAVVGVGTAAVIGSAVSAVSAVAAVGIAVWAALPGGAEPKGTEREGRGRIHIVGTGRAVAGPGGRAVSGVGAGAPLGDSEVVVERTGDADASAGGEAITGVDLRPGGEPDAWR